ncbi:MAG: HEAT repeat domain-containing protein [Elusimicrobia bacterium]|nr:HEAT repeat domain-containing protein [Elusimicrobiota bacterium]
MPTNRKKNSRRFLFILAASCAVVVIVFFGVMLFFILPGSRKTIAALAQSQRIWIAGQAAFVLTHFGFYEDRSLVLSLLDHPAWQVRRQAVRWLGKDVSIETAEILLPKLLDKSGSVVAETAAALGNSKADVLYPLAIAAAHPRWWVRQDAVVVLGKIRDPRARDFLIEALHDSDYRVRLKAAEELGALADAEAAPLRRAPRAEIRPEAVAAAALIEFLACLSDDVRQAAIEALVRMGPEIGDKIVAATYSANQRLAIGAMTVLGRLGHERAKIRLEQMLREGFDPDFLPVVHEHIKRGWFDEACKLFLLMAMESRDQGLAIKALVAGHDTDTWRKHAVVINDPEFLKPKSPSQKRVNRMGFEMGIRLAYRLRPKTSRLFIKYLTQEVRQAGYDLERLPPERPDPEKIFIQKASDLLEEKRTGEALALLEEILIRDPYRFEAHLLEGQAFLIENRCDEAMAAFERALYFNPTDLACLRGKGKIFQIQKRYSELTDLYFTARDWHPHPAKKWRGQEDFLWKE